MTVRAGRTGCVAMNNPLQPHNYKLPLFVLACRTCRRLRSYLEQPSPKYWRYYRLTNRFEL